MCILSKMSSFPNLFKVNWSYKFLESVTKFLHGNHKQNHPFITDYNSYVEEHICICFKAVQQLNNFRVFYTFDFPTEYFKHPFPPLSACNLYSWDTEVMSKPERTEKPTAVKGSLLSTGIHQIPWAKSTWFHGASSSLTVYLQDSCLV